MSHDVAQVRIGTGQPIRPEFARRHRVDSSQDGGGGPLAQPNQESDECALTTGQSAKRCRCLRKSRSAVSAVIRQLS